MYKVNKKKSEEVITKMGFNVETIEDFCYNAIEEKIENYINGYMLFITNEELELIKDMVQIEEGEESKEDNIHEGLVILLIHIIGMLNDQEKLDIEINHSQEFTLLLARLIQLMGINISLFELERKGLINLDKSTSDWKISLTEEGKKYKENNGL